MVYNYTEEVVRRVLPEVLKEYIRNNQAVCTCPRCQEDILALSLNHLPPHYVATDEGTIITRVNFDQIGGKAQVVAAITSAIKLVAANPRHKNGTTD